MSVRLVPVVVVAVAAAGCGRIEFDPGDGLVAWYTMDGDPRIDSSWHSLNASCEGSCPTSVPGIVGAAANFDGTQYLKIVDRPLLHLTSGFTISLWFDRIGGSGTGVTVVSKPQVAGVGASFEIAPLLGGLLFCTDADPGPSGEECLTAAATALGVWTHAVGTWDGALKRLIVNNSEVASAPGSTVYDGSALLIGDDAEDGVPSVPFQGLVDDVRIYDHALSDDEVAALFALR